MVWDPQNGGDDGSDLQRALEVEMVAYLWDQNSNLSEEGVNWGQRLPVAKRLQGWNHHHGLQLMLLVQWEAVRKGRPGSRIPRNRLREEAVSSENGRNPSRFTPGGTKVPDGPPPIDDDFSNHRRHRCLQFRWCLMRRMGMSSFVPVSLVGCMTHVNRSPATN